MADNNPKVGSDPNWYIGETTSGALVSIEGKVDGALVDTAAIEGKIDTAIADIATVDGVVDGLALDTAAIEGKVDTAIADIATVDTVVDGIALDTAEIAKIDSAATDGLAGTHDSLAYRAAEIERHIHGWSRWMGLAGAPDAELHRADPIGTTTTPFTVDAGNDTWGSWYQFVGSNDTPTDGAALYMDMHLIVVTAVERANTIHFVQIAWGASGAAALAAGTYSELVYYAGVAVSRAAPIDIKMRRVATGTKGWIRTWAVGQDTGTMSFFAGGHEYSG